MEQKYEDLLNWWLNIDKLTPEEQSIINIENVNPPILGDDYKNLEQKFFNKLLYSNISTDSYKIEVEESASKMIRKLFEYYVDDKTLVIHSINEHETPNSCIKKSKNSLEIDTDYFDINKYIDTIKKYKKIFVYIIGTEISTGKITSQIIYEQIKNIANNFNAEITIVCDDVHGMFVTPRDYTLFDYIIGTAHALNKNYDMGILISKKDNPIFGFKATNWMNDYLSMLDIILKRKDKMNLFYKVIGIILEKYIINKNFSLEPNVTQNIFSIKMKKIPIKKETYEKLGELFIRIEGYDNDNASCYYIRLRAQQFITHPNDLIEGIELLLKLLNAITYCWDNFN